MGSTTASSTVLLLENGKKALSYLVKRWVTISGDNPLTQGLHQAIITNVSYMTINTKLLRVNC